MPSSLNEFDSVWAPPNKAIDDRGATHDRVQDAVDNANSFVFVGPGTFEESVTITSGSVLVKGVGEESVIDGGTAGDAIGVQADDVTIASLGLQTSGNEDAGIHATGNISNVRIHDCVVFESGDHGVEFDTDVSGFDNQVVNCRFENTDELGAWIKGGSVLISECTFFSGVSDVAIQTAGPNSRVVHCHIEDATFQGIYASSGSHSAIIAENRISGASGDGIRIDSDDVVVNANRISGDGDNGIDVDGTDDQIHDNHITGTFTTDINTSDATNASVADN